MTNRHKKFRKYLMDRNIVFSDVSDDIILIEYRGEEKRKIPLICYLGEDESEFASVMALDILRFTQEERLEACVYCNTINQYAASCNVYVDDDNTLCANGLVWIHEEYFCEDIMKALSRLAETVDAAYMQFRDEMGKTEDE